MKTETKYPLSINGSMTVPGGTFSEVNINGFGWITSDLSCDSYQVNGHSNVNGNITAKDVVINGKSDIHGNIEADDIEINGKAEVKGNISTKDIQVKGNLKLEGNIGAEDFISKGKTKIEGNCEAEDFVSKGVIHISEMLNAGSIEIKLYDDSYIKEIGGEDIEIRRDGSANPLIGKLRSLLSNAQSHTLTTEIIEGDEIYIEYTAAGIVRGNAIQIGPGCNIGRIEYKESIEIDDSSTVKETVQN